MAISQDSRLLAIKTALGDGVLAVRAMTLQERLGRLFSMELELASEDAEIKFDDVVGHDATVRLQVGERSARFIHGFINRFTQLANKGGYARYRATLVPWLWFLTRTSDCRIFQEKSVPEIIEEVFKGHGFNDYRLSLSENHPAKEYCVQYRETDFNFVSRLMEQEGIYYFFEHENGKHTLVLADALSAHKPFPGCEEVPFIELEEGAAGREAVTDWTVEKEVKPVAFAQTDFDFKKPKTSMLSQTNVSRQHGQAGFEIFDFPGEYLEHAEGDHLSAVRLDEIQSEHEILRGSASARGLATGSTFKLKNHPRQDQNREYLITGVSIQVEAGEFASGEQDEGEFFSCGFTALDTAQQFRPARLTPKPIVQGPQTAMVTGPSGEEIHTDEHGRVKVQFHWDRYGKADENSSCWIRVSQAWAGKKWGAIYTPRIGQEVIVEHLEGDPDRPLVTGRVYNGDAKPPYDLPARKTIATLKSNSSKGGEGFNEIRFEDKKGEEQIFIHGEKNVDIRVKNDTFEWIGNNRHLVVKTDQIEHVENNREEIVDADHKEKIGKDRHLNVVGKEAKQVGGSLSLTVKGDVIEVFKGDHSEQTTGDCYLKADNVIIEGSTNVTVKVGQSYIAIEAGGIKIGTTGTLELESTGPLSVQSTSQTEIKAPQTTVSGDAMTAVKGGVVMIN